MSCDKSDGNAAVPVGKGPLPRPCLYRDKRTRCPVTTVHTCRTTLCFCGDTSRADKSATRTTKSRGIARGKQRNRYHLRRSSSVGVPLLLLCGSCKHRLARHTAGCRIERKSARALLRCCSQIGIERRQVVWKREEFRPVVFTVALVRRRD